MLLGLPRLKLLGLPTPRFQLALGLVKDFASDQSAILRMLKKFPNVSNMSILLAAPQMQTLVLLLRFWCPSTL